MAIVIKTVLESVDDSGVKILVHGPAGVGKTLLCATGGVKTLMISAEGGLLSIIGGIKQGLLNENVHELMEVIEVKSLEELIEAYEYAKQQDHVWICVDSITEIAEVLLAQELREAADPRQAYGAIIVKMGDVLRLLRDIKHKNVIMTCKQQRVTDSDTGKTMYLPAMPGTKLHQQIPYLFDEVLALRVEKDEDTKDYRVLQTARDANYEAKDRSCMLEMWEEPDLYNILMKIKGEVVERIEPEPEGEEDDVIIAEVDMFWLDEESGGLATTSADDDITGMYADDLSIVEITEEEYFSRKADKEAEDAKPDSSEEATEETGAADAEDSGDDAQADDNDTDGPNAGSDVEETSDAEPDADAESEPVLAKKVMYWLDVEDSATFETEKGEDISAMLEAGKEVYQEISKKEYKNLQSD